MDVDVDAGQPQMPGQQGDQCFMLRLDLGVYLLLPVSGGFDHFPEVQLHHQPGHLASLQRFEEVAKQELQRAGMAIAAWLSRLLSQGVSPIGSVNAAR